MSTETPLAIIRTVKKSYENTVVYTGVILGLILLVYFFTFAQLMDRDYWGVVYFQMISSVFIVAGLVMLRRLSLSLVRLKYRSRPEHRAFLESVTPSDLGKDEKRLLEKFHA